jgi:hypothetical protein
MLLATCRFQRFTVDMGIPVRITAGPVRFKLAYPLRHKVTEAAPDRAWLGIHDVAELWPLYERKLNAIGVDRLTELFRRIFATEGVDPDTGRLVLMCFDDLSKPSKYVPGEPAWCHRSLFGQWWTLRHPPRRGGRHGGRAG